VQFELKFTDEAQESLQVLEQTNVKKYDKVRKTLGRMETNLRHPSLNTHKYSDLIGTNGEEVFESYVENNTPGAYRVFWHYGVGQGIITIIAITPHP
jgi:hypothetical protein